MRVIICDTPKGQYQIPLEKVAEQRADHYACEVDGHEKGDSNWKSEVEYCMNDSYEGIDWLLNNTDWSEWVNQRDVIKINDDVNVTDKEFWTSSDNFKIEDIDDIINLNPMD